MEKKYNFVYITTNLANGKQYIGSHATNDLHDNYLGSGKIFKQALKKSGKDNFKRKILQECKTIIEARKLEEPMIIKYNTLTPLGYNVSAEGGWGYPGSTRSHITRKKISDGNTGQIRSAETKKKISDIKKKLVGEKHPFFGKKHKSESIIKMSENRKGLTSGKKHHYYGLKRDDEVKQKISDTLKGRKISEGQKKRLSEAGKNVERIVCEHCGKEFTPWGIVSHKRSINKDI